MENIVRICVSLFFHVFPPRKAWFTNGSKSNPPNAQVSTPTWPMRDILNLTGGDCVRAMTADLEYLMIFLW